MFRFYFILLCEFLNFDIDFLFITGTGDFGEGTPEEWSKRMSKNGEWCDQVFFRLAAECINRRIILHSVIKEDMTGLNIIVPKAELDPELPTIHMLYFNETRFGGIGHFQVLKYSHYFWFCSGSLSKVVNQEKLHI